MNLGNRVELLDWCRYAGTICRASLPGGMMPSRLLEDLLAKFHARNTTSCDATYFPQPLTWNSKCRPGIGNV